MADRAALEQQTRQLVDAGLLIEAGFISMRIATFPLDASPAQLEPLRMAFFGGAAHVFSSILAMLDGGDAVTQSDVDRIGLIAAELRAFGDQLLADLPGGHDDPHSHIRDHADRRYSRCPRPRRAAR